MKGNLRESFRKNVSSGPVVGTEGWGHRGRWFLGSLKSNENEEEMEGRKFAIVLIFSFFGRISNPGLELETRDVC